MDYSKIKLANERNSHVTKRLNRLSTWKFFKVIYRENIWRMFGYNFLMILCLLPIFVVLMLCSMRLSEIEHTMSLFNGLGFSTGAWFGSNGLYGTVDDYLAYLTGQTNLFYGGMTVIASLAATFIFSGGFAVIRDAFWTGKLSTVGVFKSMWKGIKANILYAFVSTGIIALLIFGIYNFYVWFSGIIFWLAIVLTVLLAILGLFVAIYLMILCSVTVTYKQSLADSLDDAWRLMWLNILPNLIHMLVALIPIALYFVFANSLLQQIYLIVLLMFGGLYFPLVWQTHMMKTFALFHPVEIRKKKKAAAESVKTVADKTSDDTDSDERKPKSKKKSVAEQPSAEQTADEPIPEEPQETDDGSTEQLTEEAAQDSGE